MPGQLVGAALPTQAASPPPAPSDSLSRGWTFRRGDRNRRRLVWDLLGAEAVLDFPQPREEKVPIRPELDYPRLSFLIPGLAVLPRCHRPVRWESRRPSTNNRRISVELGLWDTTAYG